MKPKLRTEFELALRGAVSNIIRMHFESQPAHQSCLNCINFIEKTEICKLANQRPPAKIIVYGCPQYEDISEIPF